MNLGQAPEAMNPNRFSIGSQVGGSQPADLTLRVERPLRKLFEQWRGEYSPAVEEFAFLLRIDGEIHQYSKLWNMIGAQAAKRKRNWVEVEIVVPESWWKEAQGELYKFHLVEEIEKGLHSMVELLKRNKHEIRAEALLSDWARLKAEYIDNPGEVDEKAIVH